MGLEQEELTGSVIGAAIEVHQALGPGSIEDVHFAVVRSYLRATGLEHGLILNFTKSTLEIKRVIASQRPYHDFLASRLP